MIPLYAGEAASRVLQDRLSVPFQSETAVSKAVSEVITQVQTQGDGALTALAQKFGDTIRPEGFRLTPAEIDAAIQRVPEDTKAVLTHAAQNINAFAQAVMANIKPFQLNQPGFQVGMDYRPVERVACYVPGGRYPLPSTALMTALTAKAAGVSEVLILCPKLVDEVIYAGHLAGVSAFYQLGGAQAVAAVAFGTQSLPKVDMLVGPGNAYVTEAKRQLQGILGIDMLAGPSEVTLIADETANPDWVALDLLAQAEHDPDARVYLLTTSASLGETVGQKVLEYHQQLQLPAFVLDALKASAILVFETLDACVNASNQIAPEHLEVHVADPMALKAKLTDYGAVFLGHQACVPHGDYLAGPNHTLPTAKTARFSGSLSPLTFLRAQTWFYPEGDITRLSQDTVHFAQLEGLTAHAASAQARL